MIRLFSSSIPEHTSRLVITGEEHNHAGFSLRVSPGTDVRILNGKGTVVTGVIENITETELICSIRSYQKVERPSPVIDIAVPLLERNSFETAVKSVTGFNVDRVFPINTGNLSDFGKRRKRLKPERLKNILVNGIKQTGNPFLPGIEDPVDLKQLNFSDYDSVICLDSSGDLFTPGLRPVQVGNRVMLLVGPEGGMTDLELEFLTGSGADLIRLNNFILRTELALIAGLVLISNNKNSE